MRAPALETPPVSLRWLRGEERPRGCLGCAPPSRPPAPLLADELASEAELLEGTRIVAEVGSDAGRPLWRGVRDLRRWAATPPGLRAGLFAEGGGGGWPARIHAAGTPRELWAPLAVLARLVERPGEVDEARLLHACRRVVAWAEGAEAFSTALAWEAAIAAAWPAARRPVG